MNRKYKIAVMGESNVGKTVFFASYFHQVTDMNRCKYHVAIKSQDADDKITEIITQLFEKHQVAAGTDVRVDFSFSVDSLGIDVELMDLPGGFTTNRNYWDDENIRNDLLNADGAISFISGYDIVNNPAEALKVNRAFSDAISEIRRHTKGDIKGRSDVPIWFIFTKGDTVSEVTTEDLCSRVPSLLEAAKQSRIRGSWFARNVYRKGGYVRAYKTQAMGKWPDAKTPPIEFDPVNVVEPIEEMLDAMISSKTGHKHTLRIIIAAISIVSLISIESLSYYIDKIHWEHTQERIIALRHSEKAKTSPEDIYPEAIKILDEFHSPITSVILPSFLRAYNSEDEQRFFRDEVYREYEAALYAPIASEIIKINESSIPKADDVFMNTARKLNVYLAAEIFSQINPEHYKNIRRSAWYFKAAQDMLSVHDDMTPDEMFEIIRRCLDYETPDTWHERIQSFVREMSGRWSQTRPGGDDPESLDVYIERAQQIMNHHKLSEQNAEFLSAFIVSLQDERDGRMRKFADKWIADAMNMPHDKALETLSAHLAKNITPEIRDKLNEALSSVYSIIADEALDKYGDSRSQLRTVVNNFPSMPLAIKDRLTERINFLQDKYVEEKIKQTRSAKTISELAKVVQSLEEEGRTSTAAQAVRNSLAALVARELQGLESEAGKYIRGNNFGEGRQMVSQKSSELQQGVRSILDDTNILRNITLKEQELTASLMDKHYSYCRSSFNARKNTTDRRDVIACINDMKGYLQTWPEAVRTGQGAQVQSVCDFLEYINGGIPGRLVIAEGDFSAEDSISDTPDMKIQVQIYGENGKHETATITDKIQPVFNTEIPIRWSVEMRSVTFKAIEVDPLSNDDVFETVIRTNGFKGYENLSQTMRDSEGNTLTIYFMPSTQIPSCAW